MSNKTLSCAECGYDFSWNDDVIKIEDGYFCIDCRIPYTDIVAYLDPFDESSWWDADDVETGIPSDFGFYEELEE